MYANNGSFCSSQDFPKNTVSSHPYYPKQQVMANPSVTSNAITNYPYISYNPMSAQTPLQSFQFNPSVQPFNPVLTSADSRPQPTDLSPSSSSASSLNANTFERKCDVVCSESKSEELKAIMSCLETMKQNNDSFQKNILNELKQMKEVMTGLKTAIHELPIRFADSLTQCLDVLNSRSDCLSVDSEAEVADVFDKIDIKECIDLSDKSVDSVDPKSAATLQKFIFPYDSELDMNKWLKKD
ncbi:unnamed protein product [Medioppia subpectinata]|uniref:Uncharacterized protein n=1 Tax=Medioppia subpectinata TaxID=1979941 RepID=A0A7R9L2T1_9ACAR|nr:unnamed protein product [Medioppia subpectinata]CAG2114230.1 unnamed protein product [Medioppia subpectinata]